MTQQEQQVYPRTIVTVGSNGALIEIYESEGTSIKSELSSNDMNNITNMWISNRLSMIDQLQQQIQQLVAVQSLLGQLQSPSNGHIPEQEVEEQSLHE